MKINVVIDSASRAAGGVFDAERRLWQSFKAYGSTISVFSLKDEFTEEDASAWLPVVPQSFPANWPTLLGRSTRLRSRLLAEPADLLYQAGLWKWCSRNAREWGQKFERPSIIAPHGMLDPWAVKNSGWKKRVALMLYERKNLESAACIRALCEAEASAIRTFGLKNPICIIPNGIDIPEIGNRKSEIENAPWHGIIEPPRKVLLYLGRIHPKKGLVNLLMAWGQIQKSEVRSQKSEWVLAIAGWDQGGHEKELKKLATELGIPWADVRAAQSASPLHRDRGEGQGEVSNSISKFQPSILFLGPQFNDAKIAGYQHCDAFILPSVSEGLPMVILEAWAYGKPVLMTPECNLPEGFTTNAAIRIEPGVTSIAKGLSELFQTPNSELRALGDHGRALVAARFTWPKIASEMKSVCNWVMGGEVKPTCVHTN